MTAKLALMETATAAAAIAMIMLGMVVAPRAVADDYCREGGPPAKAASKDVSDIYGQPATLWISDTVVGLTTPQGYSAAKISSPSPLQRRVMLVDAQQDGQHQIIVDTGREAILYVVSGCRI